MVHPIAKSVGFVIFLSLTLFLVGCNLLLPADGNGATDNLAVFSDANSNFSTMDVRDIDEQIVRFDTTAKTLIWVADGSTFVGWEVSGNFLGSLQQFQVRFGTVSGERRAYFTETGPATICDISVDNGSLRIVATDVTVPNN